MKERSENNNGDSRSKLQRAKNRLAKKRDKELNNFSSLLILRYRRRMTEYEDL